MIKDNCLGLSPRYKGSVVTKYFDLISAMYDDLSVFFLFLLFYQYYNFYLTKAIHVSF
jgi:hypothetical protein